MPGVIVSGQYCECRYASKNKNKEDDNISLAVLADQILKQEEKYMAERQRYRENCGEDGAAAYLVENSK